ncbi:acyl-CoA dehydrogenase family protein [candidate division KSB1 bacterium]
MGYNFTEEHLQLKELAHEIAEEKVRPVAAKHDVEGTFPWDIIKVFRDVDFFRIFIPEEYEGINFGITGLSLVIEELSRACAGIALSLAGTALGAYPIILFGSDEQKKKYLPQIASGEKLAAFAITEPEAGSDAGNVSTTAVKKGDKYILNGTKQWITNGGEAKIYSVIATTNRERGIRGMTAFIVEDGYPGFSYGKKEDKMGIRASATRELVFEDCEVPVENLIGGREGIGFRVAMNTFDNTRPGVAAQALGTAQGAFELAVDYTRTRKQFGTHISSFQGVQFMLADMATQIEAARALVYEVSRRIDAGDKKTSKMSAMAKLFASDTAMNVTTDAVQLFGGYGYMRDYPIEKYMRDAKITQIYEGTNQIQRSVIALSEIKESARKTGP